MFRIKKLISYQVFDDGCFSCIIYNEVCQRLIGALGKNLVGDRIDERLQTFFDLFYEINVFYLIMLNFRT